MSHFTVMVITPPGAPDDAVDKALAPFHQFECTGCDDEYVQDIDETVDSQKEYAEKTRKVILCPDGTKVDTYDDAAMKRFYRPATSVEVAAIKARDGGAPSEWRSSRGVKGAEAYEVRELPEGYTEVEVPIAEIMSFAAWAEDWYGREPLLVGQKPDLEDKHKYGYAEVNEAGDVVRIVRRTNKNAKWDWYQVGGRWSGFFALKPGASGEKGQPSLLSSARHREEIESSGRVDSALKGDIDFAAKRAEAETNAALRWDKVREIVGMDATWKPWKEFIADVDAKALTIEEARVAYREQPAKLAMDEALRAEHTATAGEDPTPLRDMFGYFVELDEYLAPRDVYIRRQGNAAGKTFAVLHEGKWMERGKMGWWATVSNEMDEEVWDQQIEDLLTSLPDDARLTIIDAHI